MKNSILLIFRSIPVAIGVICCTCHLADAQSWTTSGDTISSSGYVKAVNLNVTGSSVRMPGLVTDTSTDLLGIDRQGNVHSLTGGNLNNVIYLTAPAIALTCDTTKAQWYKQFIFGGSAVVTRVCTFVGVGEAGIAGFPDAPLSVSNSNAIIQFSVVNPTSLRDMFTIDKNGNTVILGSASIGDSMTTPGNYGLYVRKGILTSIVKIALPTSGSWSDYVFGNNYKLKPLPEVERYIKENKHLPDVPSADNVQKNGINVGEMDAVMMKKIEELTLYIIQQDKKIQALQDKVDALSSENKK